MAAPTLDYARVAPTSAAPPTPYAWAVVVLLSVVAALNYLDRLMITHMRKPLMADLHINEETFGLFTTVFLFSYALCSPLGGFLADRVGKRSVIITSLLFWSLATAVSGHAHTAGHLIAARILMGVSEACYIPAALALISDYHRGSTRSLATGIHMVGLYVGSSVGALSGYIAASLGWRAGFHIFGWFGVAYFVLLFFTLRDAPKSTTAGTDTFQDKPAFGRAMASLFSRTGFYILLGVNVLVGIANWVVNGWLPAFLGERFSTQLSSGDASAMTIVVQVSSFIGVIAAGAIADRWSRSYPKARAIVPGIGWMVAGPALIVLALSGFLPLTVVCLVLFGLGRGAFDANQMPIVRVVVPEKYSATAYGFLNMIGTTFGGIAIWAGGRLRDAKVDSSIMFTVGGAALIVTACLLMIIRTRRSGSDDGTILPPDELAAATVTETGSVPTGAVNASR
jgi:MFS family permease